MEAFSDGVFAIAITLLVLEITVPAGADGRPVAAVVDQWPSYLAYVVSFSTIGASGWPTASSPSTSITPTPSSPAQPAPAGRGLVPALPDAADGRALGFRDTSALPR